MWNSCNLNLILKQLTAACLWKLCVLRGLCVGVCVYVLHGQAAVLLYGERRSRFTFLLDLSRNKALKLASSTIFIVLQKKIFAQRHAIESTSSSYASLAWNCSFIYLKWRIWLYTQMSCFVSFSLSILFLLFLDLNNISIWPRLDLLHQPSLDQSWKKIF